MNEIDSITSYEGSYYCRQRIVSTAVSSRKTVALLDFHTKFITFVNQPPVVVFCLALQVE